MSFDLERIEEAARANLGAGQRPVVVQVGDCECDRLGRSLNDECLYTNPCDFVLRRPRNYPTPARSPLATPSSSEVLALVEVVKAARALLERNDQWFAGSIDVSKDDVGVARLSLRAALGAFGDEQSSSSGGKTA